MPVSSPTMPIRRPQPPLLFPFFPLPNAPLGWRNFSSEPDVTAGIPARFRRHTRSSPPVSGTYLSLSLVRILWPSAEWFCPQELTIDKGPKHPTTSPYSGRFPSSLQDARDPADLTPDSAATRWSPFTLSPAPEVTRTPPTVDSLRASPDSSPET
jgi:hypothetical protein